MHYHSVSHAPRRGQALLLAVLIMIFAALLSASFITIVAVNLNQTARQTDKNKAVAAAQAGMDYVNRQLAYSNDGEKWFDVNYAPTLAALSSNSSYYSALDTAQGWAGAFAKFPDPRNIGGGGDGPQFLAKVEKLTSSDPQYDGAGTLKITVVGLSPDDPTAYSTLIAYKGGYKQSPIGRNMRTVSNWDFANGVVPAAVVTTASPTATIPYNATTHQVTLMNVQGAFPTASASDPFSVMIGDPTTYAADNTRVARGAVVIGVSGNALTFAVDPSPLPKAGERIEMAASLGAPRTVDYNNNGSSGYDGTYESSESVPVEVADSSTSSGVRVNGGLWWSGTMGAETLRATQDATAAIPASTIQSSGLMAKNPPMPSSPSPSASAVTLIGQGLASGNLLNSEQASFPFAAAVSTPTGTTRDQLVSDGWNRLQGVPSASTRAVSNFQPPALDTGQNLERYRNLTRFSTPLSSSDPVTASSYGGGQGIYLDNSEDKEKIVDSSSGINKLREMTQAELVNMWVSQPVPATATVSDYMRTATTLVAANTANSGVGLNGSLEQQHLRGWVGTDEFRARGAEIVLGDASTPNAITITRDARDDDYQYQFGGSPTKTWKNYTTGANQTGVYTKTFAWPANGVIFAEGNVRIRGNATNAPRSLTVVSMGNIYIEDSLSADDATEGINTGSLRKILLLAKKNVVMNPTRVMGRPDAQTISKTATNVTNGTTLPLDVYDGSSFKVGDFIQTETITLVAGPPATTTEVITSQGYVTATAATQISYKPTYPTTGTAVVVANSIVRTPSTSEKVVSSVRLTGISSATDVIQRRLTLPTGATTAKLGFNHQAERKTALTVSTTGTKPTTPVYFGHKRPATFSVSATTISQANKQVRIDYTQPSTSTDVFPSTLPTTESAAQLLDLTALRTYLLSAPVTANHPAWTYGAVRATGYNSTPFFYLASVGNRYSYGFNPAVAVNPDFRPNVNVGTIGPANLIPIGTSINVNQNGTAATLINEHWNGTNYEQTTNFGFNPKFLDPISPIDLTREDILTSEQSFYSADPIRTTLDSRTISATADRSLVMRPNAVITASGAIAEYRLRDIKLENVALAANSDAISTINPGYTFNVNAYVYAQTGSWFVIPDGLFNDRLRVSSVATYYDLNNDKNADSSTSALSDTNEFITVGAEKYPDLNRNGVIDDSERYAMARYCRYNYQINFTGAIAENQAPVVNPVYDTSATPVLLAAGAVDSWMNSWATASKASGSTTITYDRIKYNFDPTIATDSLDSTSANPDYGFRMPQTLSLSNIS